MWSKQFYHYIVEQWLEGDPAQPPPPNERRSAATRSGVTFTTSASCRCRTNGNFPGTPRGTSLSIDSLALVDPHFAKGQLDVIVREWYQHPNGQIPAYEWNFSDVNPPVLAWAAWRVFQIEGNKPARRPRISRNDFSQNAHRLYLVGESQRPRETTFFRVDSSGSTTSACSTVTPVSPMAAISSKAMAPVGWECFLLT